MPSPFASLFGEGISAEHPSASNFLNDELNEFPLRHRSDDSRAGRGPDVAKLRSTSKSSRVRARPFYAKRKSVGLIGMIFLSMRSDSTGYERATEG
jgi:hypothetical protein